MLEKLRYLAGQITVGEQASGLLCPQCSGGQGREHSLNIFRDATTIAWTCHRASCNFRGKTSINPSAAPVVSKRKPVVEFDGELEALPTETEKLLLDKYYMSKEDCVRMGLMWAPSYMGGRLAMPIKNRMGVRVGWTFRSLSGGKPKTINMLTNSSAVCVSWYPRRDVNIYSFESKPNPLLVVEDQLSAYRASSCCSAVALLGTDLSATKMADILRVNPSELIIALDQDATAKAASFMNIYSGLVDNLRMLVLKKDLKDLPPDQLDRMFQ